MFKNYVTVALRNIAKNRLYSAINILGLAVGIASCILITLFVRGELGYDSWLADSDRVYRVETRFDIPGRAPMIGGSAPGPVLAALQKDFSQIETGVRLSDTHAPVKRGADVFREAFIFADPTFFDVFKLPMAAGIAALPDATAVVISEAMARKYFGSSPAVGQVIDATLSFGPDTGGPRSLHVVGVFKDLPDNTHLKIDFLARLNESDFEKAPWVTQQWTSANTMTYVKLRPGAHVEDIASGMKTFIDRNAPVVSFNGQDFKVSDFMKLTLLPLKDIHLHSKGFGQLKPPGDVRTVATFSVVALMILVIACINFTNLATARASQRAREVALRKVLGAKRPQLVVQFLSESVLTALIALAIAIGLVELALPSYNAVLGTHLALDVSGSAAVLAALFVLLCLVGIVAGLYPAQYLSGFLPSRILKANKSAAAEGSGRLRTALVVVQFAISIGLLICTAIVYGQTVYAKTLDMGYDRAGLMVVRLSSFKQTGDFLLTLKQRAAKVPGVVVATRSDDVPTDTDSNNNIVEIPGKPSPEPMTLGERAVDYDFFATYKVPLLAGRFLDDQHGADIYPEKQEDREAKGANIVINVRALKRLGLGSPQDAIGQQLFAASGDIRNPGRMTLTIVGVVGDFAFRSAHEEIEPMMFEWREKGFRNLTVRYDGVTAAAVRDGMGRLWHEMAPESPYRAEFLDQLVEQQYKAETAQSEMFAAFAVLAIIIACLGLYGSAAFTAERRIKEIGLRKVLGAKVREVVQLLVWDFSKPVMLANVIAWPAAWFLMRDWLNGFQYRIALNPGVFAAAGFAALLVAWATVAAHAARAARSNPIHALRYE
jgi:putative ABC transport system permease protein